METADVVVVGGGIAGSALATVLARAGRAVVLLERATEYRDKVRGEMLSIWGVEEMRRLGLEDTFLAAGGCYATRAVFYDETVDPAHAAAAAVPTGMLVPGVPGPLDVGHPQACVALIRAAGEAGARVVRGSGRVEVRPGTPASVRFEAPGGVRELRCDLVVGADGRHSAVRKALGLALAESVPRTRGGGLLVDGLDDWPAAQLALGTEGDLYYLVFPRAHGRVRLYLLHDLAQRGRFAGPGGAQEFLRAYRFDCIPDSAMFEEAEPAGPCVFYPMNDSWTTADPLAPGVVLVGDAAGWNDPIIGQGLAIALRDVRLVTDLVLAGEPFDPYVAERRERMRRLRISASTVTDLACTFTPRGAARRVAHAAVMRSDPVLGGARLVSQLGPDRLPAEAFTEGTRERILAMG